ncbi:MAG: hypothetical protein SOV58_03050 [Candidatus Enteromonas sp.]|nr:hypothetical protein [Candidatus Enteromonas sp.]
MPAALLHRLFTEDALKDFPSDYPEFVFAGAQGPDPFMAYGTNPFLGKKDDASQINPWGSQMHRTHLKEVYGPMLRYAYEKSGREAEILFAYIEGLLLHFTLDRLVHPYVFYRSGFDENGKYGGIYVFYHGAFESILDKTYAKRTHRFIPPAKALPRLSEEDLLSLSQMWSACATVPLKPTAFSESYREFASVLRLLYSRTGFKRKLFRWVLGKTSKAYSLSYPASLKRFAPLDVENASRQEWKDPCTGEVHHESIPDLLQKALKDACLVRDIVSRAKKGEDVGLLLEELEGNRDHDGEVYGEKKKYCDICFLSHPVSI